MREAGDRLRVQIIERRPTDLEAAEHAAIVKYCPEITNIQLNPFKTLSGLGINPGENSETALCVRCDAPVTIRKSKYCRKCLGALLGMSGGQSKQQLRDLCEQIQIERKSNAAALNR